MENQGVWKSLFGLELRKYGSEVTFAGNLNKKDSCNIIKVSDPFIKEIREIWSEANFELTSMSDDRLSFITFMVQLPYRKQTNFL